MAWGTTSAGSVSPPQTLSSARAAPSYPLSSVLLFAPSPSSSFRVSVLDVLLHVLLILVLACWAVGIDRSGMDGVEDQGAVVKVDTGLLYLS